MVAKKIILMRHAEREDRAMEKEGKDWISTAKRPQDPFLSEGGRLQAKEVGRQLQSVGVTKILCSPLIRTVMTADIIAESLGLGENSICVESSLVEEAKSFRGKTAAEPRPNWDPLILPVSSLQQYSTRIDPNYSSIMIVEHTRDESTPNTVREVHAHLTDRDEITKDRYREAIRRLIADDSLDGEVVLCVAHGASVKHCAKELEKDLPEELHCQGERSVSCFAEFEPFDVNNALHGPWKAVHGIWKSGDICHNAADDQADRADGDGPEK